MRCTSARMRTFFFLAAVVVVLAAAPGVALASGESAADAQYAPVAPITKPATSSQSPPPPQVVAEGTSSGKPGSDLPFTGLSLLAPVGLSIALIVCGIALRRKLSA